MVSSLGVIGSGRLGTVDNVQEDRCTQSSWVRDVRARWISGFLRGSQTHNLSAIKGFCRPVAQPSHMFASPYMRRVPLYAGDETAACPRARTGTIRAFRDQLPFTHVFIVSEPPHAHTHTHAYNKTNPLWQLRCLSKCSVTEYYLLQQRTELHNSLLSSLTESPHLYPTYTHPYIDLITSTHTHTRAYTQLSHTFSFLPDVPPFVHVLLYKTCHHIYLFCREESEWSDEDRCDGFTGIWTSPRMWKTSFN